MKRKYKSQATKAVHEMMSGFYQAGAIPKTTMREFDELCLETLEKLTPDEIKAIREETHASQPVFAHRLNVSPSVVSQWERGERAPSGAALKLLYVVKRRGMDVLL